MTVAISLLVHGEAVRFNRGQSRGDDYDFKYMRGRDGREYPYVSSQCYKRYWRESLPGLFSPITREKNAAGQDKNQAYTSGNPMIYVDDDLFGYMIAGATDTDDDNAGGVDPSDKQDRREFEAENLKDANGLKTKLLDGSPLSQFILSSASEAAENLQSSSSPEELHEVLLNLLDEAARKSDLAEIEIPGRAKRKSKKLIGQGEIRKSNRSFLLRVFSKELQERPKLDTIKRTAPVRMHALVAFSGIKMAKDFQTFSRDVAFTGKNSIVNPASQGIYSGWLKTRILIESQRIGKFYVGKNMDIRKDQVGNHKIVAEVNPYSRDREHIEYVQLDDSERTSRLRAALRALADIGNRQGPASGALHDGSLRPKAFIAGMMNCADSPFDYVWTGHSGDAMPNLDMNRLREAIADWDDLFASKKIYIGLPGIYHDSQASSEIISPSLVAGMKETIESGLKEIGYEAVVETPRKALLRLAEEVSL